MPAEPNITDLFRSAKGAPSGKSIDTQAVIRRSRRRRLPKQLGAGGVYSLAIAGIGVTGVMAVGNLRTGTEQSTLFESDSDVGDFSAGSPADQEALRAPAEKLNLCGGPLAEVAPSSTGLELTVDFPDAVTGAEMVEGSVTLTNNGSERVTGYSAPLPAITLSQNGIVVWHSNGPMIMSVEEVDLAPGESRQYAAFFEPVVCATEDELGEGFRAKLPAAPAGEYQVSAALELVGEQPTELITGPAETITLR